MKVTHSPSYQTPSQRKAARRLLPDPTCPVCQRTMKLGEWVHTAQGPAHWQCTAA